MSDVRKPPWLSEPSPIERLRHCWITDNDRRPEPALLLEWRQSPSGWEARVVRPFHDTEDEKWRVREQWLPSAYVSQNP